MPSSVDAVMWAQSPLTWGSPSGPSPPLLQSNGSIPVTLASIVVTPCPPYGFASRGTLVESGHSTTIATMAMAAMRQHDDGEGGGETASGRSVVDHGVRVRMCHDERVPRDDTEPEHLPGAVGGATRVGRTVRRPTGPWTPAVHELLTYLHDNGLRGIPELHGMDEDGREVLEYVEGRGVPVDKEIVLDNVLAEAVTWLRDFHDLVEGFRPQGVRAVAWR